MGRRHTRRHETLPFGRMDYAVVDEVAQGLLIEVLQLATAAAAEVAAGRARMMRPRQHSAVCEPLVPWRCTGNMASGDRHAVPLCRYSDDLFGLAHKQPA